MEERPSPLVEVRSWFRQGGYRVVILGALYVGLFLPQIVDLADVVWRQDKYSHGWLIPPVCLFWLWAHRERLGAVPRAPANSGLVAIATGLLLWVVAQNTSYNALAHVAMLVTLAGMVAFTSGFGFLRRVAFPILYLGFAFPVPKRLDELYVVLPLQRLAASVGEHIIDFLGIPVIRQGNLIEVPGIRLFVEEACSGIHSLYSLGALGTAVAFLFPFRGWVRLVLVLATIPIAILANVVRVAGTGVLAYTVSPKLAEGFSHTFAGLLVFLLGLLLFLAFAAGMRALFPARTGPAEG